MKYLKRDGDNFVFQLSRREQSLLRELLELYPVVPVSHHQLGASNAGAAEANQKLLEEALQEHREENKRALKAMLEEGDRFQESSSGVRLVLNSSQLEWLLQVLNDIRVGSWINLGSPDERHGKQLRLTVQNARYLWAMELSGHFQVILLNAQNAAE